MGKAVTDFTIHDVSCVGTRSIPVDETFYYDELTSPSESTLQKIFVICSSAASIYIMDYIWIIFIYGYEKFYIINSKILIC